MSEQLNYDVIILNALERATKRIEPFDSNENPLIKSVNEELNVENCNYNIVVTFRNGAKVKLNPNNVIKEPDEQSLSIGQQMVRQMFEGINTTN